MIIGKNVSKTYVGEPLFTDLNFKIGNNRKVALVGRNGCGKSTLFKLIVGEEDLTSGNIEITEETIGYIPQEIKFDAELVGECLEPKLENEWDSYIIDILVNDLRFSNYDPYQKIETLSEGQKLKLKLMEILLDDPTVLLIDEPTNHLDIEGIIWFEDYLKSLEKSVVMISHDREFLNSTVDEVWEMERGKMLTFVGNYDNYKSEKLKLIDKWDEEYVLFLKRKAKLERLLHCVRKIEGGKARGKAVRATKKRIEREVVKDKKEKYENKRISSVKFNTDITSQKLMVRMENVEKLFGDNVVFQDLSFEIRAGEKIWLFGPNGVGKTTLVKMIVGEEKPTSGEVKIGNSIEIGYFAQKQTHLDLNKNILEHFTDETHCPNQKAYGYLKRFLFDKDSIQLKVQNLSPGERARFAFAIFAHNDYDMLILDEPTNHLDIETKEVIEESLKEYKGTLLLVSHDRFFVERVGVNKRLNLSSGRLEYI
ncbi:ABC-F family ATP-binding cassette domain-containing protein [Patescibacteria group bacterium]|nr:ABC-F family ATP-binding cassette domain-containing protein [Patescibacteria group bacterium]